MIWGHRPSKAHRSPLVGMEPRRRHGLYDRRRATSASLCEPEPPLSPERNRNGKVTESPAQGPTTLRGD
jgi:hypothetical protein